MADKKVRITEKALSNYTGHMFGVPIVNSVTVDVVSERRQTRMLAALRGEVLEPSPPKEEETTPTKVKAAPKVTETQE